MEREGEKCWQLDSFYIKGLSRLSLAEFHVDIFCSHANKISLKYNINMRKFHGVEGGVFEYKSLPNTAKKYSW